MKKLFQILKMALLPWPGAKRTLQIGSLLFVVFIMGIFSPNLLSAQVSKCQNQCTSTSPEAPCSAVRGNPTLYQSCVAKCRQECTACSQQPTTAEPELVFRQFVVNCPSDAVLDKLTDGLKSNLKQLGLANPDVRLQCQSGNVTALVWSGQAKNSCEDRARSAASPPSNFTAVPFGLYITKGLLAALAQATFTNNPTLRTVPGYPSIHLTSLAVRYMDNNDIQNFEKVCSLTNSCRPKDKGDKDFRLTVNNVVTIVNGHDDRTTPSTDFTVTVIDDLEQRLDDSGHACHPLFDSKCGCPSLSWTNVSELDEFLAIPGLIAGVVSLDFPLAGVLQILTGDINALVDHPGGGAQGGVGCSVYQSLPDEIALPQTGHSPIAEHLVSGAGVPQTTQRKKLVISYQPPLVTPGAVEFLATVAVAPRVAALRLLGPASLNVNRHDTDASAEYTVESVPLYAANFFGQVTTAWFGDPAHVKFSNRGKTKTNVVFHTDPKMKPGTSVEQPIEVRVSDEEGTSVTARMNVLLVKLTTDPPPPKPNPPPSCKMNPWAKECQTQPQ